MPRYRLQHIGRTGGEDIPYHDDEDRKRQNRLVLQVRDERELLGRSLFS